MSPSGLWLRPQGTRQLFLLQNWLIFDRFPYPYLEVTETNGSNLESLIERLRGRFSSFSVSESVSDTIQPVFLTLTSFRPTGDYRFSSRLPFISDGKISGWDLSIHSRCFRFTSSLLVFLREQRFLFPGVVSRSFYLLNPRSPSSDRIGYHSSITLSTQVYCC